MRKAAAIAASFGPRDLLDPQVRSAKARCEEKVGDMVGPLGERASALTHYRAALDAAKGDPVARFRILAKVAQMQADGGDPAAALISYRGCEQAALVLETRNPDDPVARNALALARERIAWFAVQAGDPKGAEEQIQNAIAIYQRMPPTPRARRNLAMAYKTMAAVQQRAGSFPDALQSIRKSMAITESLATIDAKNEQFQIDLAQEKVQLIDLLIQNGQHDQSRVEAASALAWLGPRAHQEPPSLYFLTDYLAIAVGTPFRDLVPGADAVSLAKKGVALTHEKDSETLDLLAKEALGTDTGNREEAIATEKKGAGAAATGRSQQACHGTAANSGTDTCLNGRQVKQASADA